jgi:hypothetical protein
MVSGGTRHGVHATHRPRTRPAGNRWRRRARCLTCQRTQLLRIDATVIAPEANGGRCVGGAASGGGRGRAAGVLGAAGARAHAAWAPARPPVDDDNAGVHYVLHAERMGHVRPSQAGDARHARGCAHNASGSRHSARVRSASRSSVRVLEELLELYRER